MGKAARDESRGRGVGEQGRLRLGDPQAGLSHAYALAGPTPALFPRDQAREAHCRVDQGAGGRAGGGGRKHALAAGEAPVPMVTWGVSQL